MLRVASVPAGHPYVRAVIDPELVAVPADPEPLLVEVPGQWWPPRWLDPAYLRERIGEIDLLHVHFGFDAISARTLTEVCSTLAAHRIPLVVTVHDLHNPHFADAATHRGKLSVLVAAAAEVITLTDGAALVISARWKRSPRVLPHPHLLPLSDVGAPRTPRRRPVVAVHGKALRANIDPWPVLDVLSSAETGAVLRLDLDQDALTAPHAPDALPDRLAQYTSRGVDVRVHPPFDDGELRGYLREIDVLVLPYRFGTHSGWLELCYDAGVAVVVPDCGHFCEQQRSHVFSFDALQRDRASLLAAVDAAVDDARTLGGAEDHERRRFRARQRRWVRREHVGIYHRLAGLARDGESCRSCSAEAGATTRTPSQPAKPDPRTADPTGSRRLS